MGTKKKTSAKSKSAKESVLRSKAKISKDMTLGELAAKHPETSEVMFRYGLHCAGCHMAAHETIEQGALAHGIDAKTIEKMMKELNSAVANK
ncbi:MAG: DUF1858 domain-containing protein [Candidatus Aenigmarchaeota archaeon]|nr:DUF1858 domain-containing protein [Candidatus Aenigmarchaeota archaeon]